MSSTFARNSEELEKRASTVGVAPVHRKPLPKRAEPINVHINEVPASPAANTKTTGNQGPKSLPPDASDGNKKSSGYPLVQKPIVIPSILDHANSWKTSGMPFVRGYAKCLEIDYSISAKDFLAFIDELNVVNRGHLAFSYISKAGSVIHTAGHLDPTNITKLVGQSIKVAGMYARWASQSGPLSNKKSFITMANEEIFNPKGLKVEIVDSKHLRGLLDLAPDAPLVAPQRDSWNVPSEAQLKQRQRAKLRVPHRLILQLLPLVHDISLHGEYDQVFRSQPASSLRKKAIEEVISRQVTSEIRLELHRGIALSHLKKANVVATEKEKQKLLKASRKADREISAAEKASWLLIRNV